MKLFDICASGLTLHKCAAGLPGLTGPGPTVSQTWSGNSVDGGQVDKVFLPIKEEEPSTITAELLSPKLPYHFSASRRSKPTFSERLLHFVVWPTSKHDISIFVCHG